MNETIKHLFSYQPYWANCFGTSTFLPTSRQEMELLGWDSCDIIIVTGDAYIDHPSFGMALIGRLLEAQGFRVGIISQPRWDTPVDFTCLGAPNLFFGITAGNMDSMVNHYTSERKIRSDDAYTPLGVAGKRPDRAVIVYSQRCREAYSATPIIIGSIEASLRRLAHYDYWSDKVRRSVLIDAKADMLIYGNAERAIVELSHRLAKGEAIKEIRNIRGTAFSQKYQQISDEWQIIDVSSADFTKEITKANNSENISNEIKVDISALSKSAKIQQIRQKRQKQVIRLPAYEVVRDDKLAYAYTSRYFHLETNPGNARSLVQQHGDRDVWINPPPIPLTTEELDAVYDFPYARLPHPCYNGANIPAWEMIRNSVNIMRGCFGGCTFCSITEHEGRIIQSRSPRSILREIEAIRDQGDGFTGVISDLGGPTANMWMLKCKDAKIESSCRRLSCVYPEICSNLDTNQKPLVDLYRQARQLPGIKKVLIGSGVRYDLAIKTPEYVKELTTHHVGGYLKIAPEHTEEETLSKMMKPSIDSYYQFKQLFTKYSLEAGKEQFLIPYFIAAHPGSSDKDMLNLAVWLKKNKFRPDQVQTFLPSPMAMATTMYYSGYNPLKKIERNNPNNNQTIFTAKAGRQRRLQKAFLRYHDENNWQMLRDALRQMGRADLIGNSQNHLVPAYRAIPVKQFQHLTEAEKSKKKSSFYQSNHSKNKRVK